MEFLQSFNWVDYAILIILFIYAIEGFGQGLIGALLDLLSFVLAFLAGLSFYRFIGGLLVSYFSIPTGFASALGFFIAAFLTELLLGYFLKKASGAISLYFKTDFKTSAGKYIYSLLGVVPGILSALLLLSFILTLIATLPFSAFLKKSVSSSVMGNQLVSNTQGYSKEINSIFGGAVNEALSFLTVQPKSDETVNLNFKTDKLTTDNNSEQEMFNLVNKERTERGLDALEFDNQLRDLGRSHCEDMFKRGYFSHYTPEGLSPFDRMVSSDISYTYAGENLALAPNTKLAMDGLMNSPGHKANILSEDFGTIGIGAIDGGIYGIMFCQEFTD